MPRWMPKRKPPTIHIRVEPREINGKIYMVKIGPPRPAQGAWFQESNQRLTHREVKCGQCP